MMRKVTPFFAVGTAFAVGACTEVSSHEPEIRPVRTIAADPQPLADTRRAVGEVKARYESELGFRVSGKIVHRAVEVGARVTKGALIARIDDHDYQNKLRSANAELASAQAVLVEAQGAEARQRQLLSTGATTRANYDAALKNMRSAEAKLLSAKAGVDQALDQLAYCNLRAEFDGIVTAASAEPGQVVNTGQAIARIARPDHKDAVFAVAEAAFLALKDDGTPLHVVVSLLSNPAITAQGVVREIAPVADASTRTYQVRVTLNNPPEEMRLGGSVAGRLKGDETPVVVLPGTALFDKGGVPAVWVVDRDRGVVTLKTVTTSRF
jgi:RND family efflux transporter MFP subunit